MATAPAVRWEMRGRGYEFCNCDFGCGCNFGGFPNSKDGSCRAFVGCHILEGRAGNIDLSGVKCAGIFDWPKAIHEGNGKAVFIVDPSTTDGQIEMLAQIFTGKAGGLPWEVLGATYEVVGLQKARITIGGEGRKSTFQAEGIAEARGGAFTNPVSGEEHLANVDLPDGFIWKKGQCGRGSYRASANGISIGAENSNWIFYEFDWSNVAAPAMA